jgi:hypothetical protein
MMKLLIHMVVYSDPYLLLTLQRGYLNSAAVSLRR